jgi:hypothetical protein
MQKKVHVTQKGKLCPKGRNAPSPIKADFHAVGENASLQPCKADGMARSLPTSDAKQKQKRYNNVPQHLYRKERMRSATKDFQMESISSDRFH